MLRGRCACRVVSYEVEDAFLSSFACHCSNCQALTGSAFLPWGEIEREKVVLDGPDDGLLVLDGSAVHCAACLSLLLWTVGDGRHARIPYGTLVDEPTLLPTAHIHVGSKASWHEIGDGLPQHAAGAPSTAPGR